MGSYKSGVTTCQDECANRLPNGRPLPASLLLKPTTDWIFRYGVTERRLGGAS